MSRAKCVLVEVVVGSQSSWCCCRWLCSVVLALHITVCPLLSQQKHPAISQIQALKDSTATDLVDLWPPHSITFQCSLILLIIFFLFVSCATNWGRQTIQQTFSHWQLLNWLGNAPAPISHSLVNFLSIQFTSYPGGFGHYFLATWLSHTTNKAALLFAIDVWSHFLARYCWILLLCF